MFCLRPMHPIMLFEASIFPFFRQVVFNLFSKCSLVWSAHEYTTATKWQIICDVFALFYIGKKSHDDMYFREMAEKKWNTRHSQNTKQFRWICEWWYYAGFVIPMQHQFFPFNFWKHFIWYINQRQHFLLIDLNEMLWFRKWISSTCPLPSKLNLTFELALISSCLCAGFETSQDCHCKLNAMIAMMLQINMFLWRVIISRLPRTAWFVC